MAGMRRHTESRALTCQPFSILTFFDLFSATLMLVLSIEFVSEHSQHAQPDFFPQVSLPQLNHISGAVYPPAQELFFVFVFLLQLWMISHCKTET